MIARTTGAGLASLGAALLVIAEFTTVYEVTVGSLEVVKRSATGGENHDYALLVVAAAAGLMTRAALASASRPPAAALVALGIAALAIALAVDLPDTRGSGGLPESLAYERARARAGTGLILTLTGAVMLIAGGTLFGSSSLRATRTRNV